MVRIFEDHICGPFFEVQIIGRLEFYCRHGGVKSLYYDIVQKLNKIS